MKKICKVVINNIPGFILGLILASGVGIVVAENIASSSVDYNKNSQATVEDALDDLYEKAAGAQNVYANEITNPAANTTYEDEIGLMYVSDYMYGASPNYWNLKSNGYSSAKTNNWIALGTTEWTITRKSNLTDASFKIDSEGNIFYEDGYVQYGYFAVRPVFYLKSDVIYYDGTGSSSDPYRIVLSE